MSDSPDGSDYLSRNGMGAEDWRACLASARAASDRLRLVFSRDARGAPGGVSGPGSGVSIDFKDHRGYLPGDDPRHINWQAYARTGNPVLKVFHEEISPRVEILADLSASHAYDKEKLAMTLRLALFACFSAGKLGASTRVHLMCGDRFKTTDPGVFTSGRWELPAAETTHSAQASCLDRVPWRGRTLRVVVSDLLFPGDPGTLLAPLSHEASRVLLFAPRTHAESDPDWKGQVTLTDCETGERRERRGGMALRESYAGAYRRHFALWEIATRRAGASLARVPCGGDFTRALLGEPVRVGAIEPA